MEGPAGLLPGDGRVVSDAFFRTVVDSSSDVLAVVDADAKLIYASPSAWTLLGLAPTQPIDRDVLDLVHPDDLDRVKESLTETLARPGEAPPREFRLASSDGNWRHVESRAINLLHDPVVKGVVLRVRDVSDKAHLNRARLTLGQGNQALVRSTDELGLLEAMCRTVVVSGGYRLAWVGYAEDDPDKTVRPIACAGDVEYVRDLQVSWGEDRYGRGPTGTAIRTGEVQVTHDIRECPEFVPWRSRALSHGLVTSLVLPLSKDGRVIGALSIYSDEVGSFDQPSVELLQELAGDLAYGIARLRDADRLARSLDATIEALATMNEVRDLYTAGHQRRVGVLAEAIAVQLGVAPETTAGIRVAGQLHDVGKIAVPTEILAKPARLTEAEMALVKLHPGAGFDIIGGIEFPWPVAEMVLQHHERLDGSGYPRGLSGDQVVLGARVLAVADTVEAISNHRPYRPALGVEKALAEIAAGSGTLFDPEVVAACVELFDKGPFDYESGSLPTRPDTWVLPLSHEMPRLTF